MIELENIETGEALSGDEFEYFIDDDTLIGEVYLDGNLIFQEFDVVDEKQLKRKLYKIFKITKLNNEIDDIFSDFTN